jgi:hypothetical protein
MGGCNKRVTYSPNLNRKHSHRQKRALLKINEKWRGR